MFAQLSWIHFDALKIYQENWVPVVYFGPDLHHISSVELMGIKHHYLLILPKVWPTINTCHKLESYRLKPNLIELKVKSTLYHFSL